MVQSERETLGETPKNRAGKLQSEEEEETAQESTQHEGQDEMQISLDVERNRYADHTGAEQADVDQKVAGAVETNEINREKKPMERTSPEKMVSAKKKRQKNEAKLVAGAKSAGSLAAETVDVDNLAAERKSDLIVAAESKKKRKRHADQTGAEQADVDQKVAGALEINEINGVKKSMERKSPEKMVSAKKNRQKNEAKLVTGAKSAGSIAAETVDVDKLAAERKSDLIVAAESKKERKRYADQTGAEQADVVQKVAGAVEINEINREKKSMERTSPEKLVSAEKNRQKNEAKLVAGATSVGSLGAETVDVDKLAAERKSDLIVAAESKKERKRYADQTGAEQADVDQKVAGAVETNEINKEKKPMEQKSPEKMVSAEKNCQENEAKLVAGAKSAQEGEVKKITEEEVEGKKKLEHNKKAEEEIEVRVKTETKQKLLEKMEIDEIVEKKLENEQSEGKCKKPKKSKRANKVKEGEVEKITEEEGEGKKITQEGEVKKITEEEGEGKKITQEEGEVKTMKVDGTVEKNPENDQSKSKKRKGANIEKEEPVKKTRQEEIATEEQENCNTSDVIEMLVDTLTRDELLEVVKLTTLKVEGFLAHVDHVASLDESKRTICVKNLNYVTNSEMLRKAFLQYGKIEKAEVAVNKERDKSMGFGFVVFTTKSSALSALRDPIKEIDGRQSHCYLKEDRRKSSLNSYKAMPSPRKSVNPAMHGRGAFVNPRMFGPQGYANPTVFGRGGYVNPTVFGPGVNSTFSGHLNPQAVLGDFQSSNQWGHSNLQYVNPTVSGPRVNSTFSGHLNPRAVLGDFQSSNQWGHSNLQYEYSGSQYNGIEHVERCGCGSIYCDL